MASSVHVKFNHFPELAKALPEIARKLNTAAAMNIQQRAQAKAPVDTGALKNAYYTVTQDSDGESGALAAASAANAKAQTITGHDPLPSPTAAMVVNGMAYAVPVEYGSIHGHAQPSLTPAVAEEAPEYEKAWRALESHLKGAVR